MGPLLFILYASERFNVLEAHLPSVHCYADDTQLYLSFRPNDNHGEDDALKAMEMCVQDIRVWLSKNKLFMNGKKTEFLVIGTRQQLKKVSIDCLTIGTEKISVAEKPVKNLGVWLGSKLSMDGHITNTCSAAFYYLILKESKFCHITPLLMTLHWLPVKYRIHFKILLLTFKAINFLAPSYICDLVTLKKPSNYNLRSNNSLVLDPPEIKSLPTPGDKSFSVAAPKLWNKLPNYIRTSASTSICKSRLKTSF